MADGWCGCGWCKSSHLKWWWCWMMMMMIHSKWLNIFSHTFFHCLVGPPFKFFRYELYGNIPTGTPIHVVTLLIDHWSVGHVREPLLKVCCCGSQSFRRCVCILQCLHVCVIIGRVLRPDGGSAGSDSWPAAGQAADRCHWAQPSVRTNETVNCSLSGGSTSSLSSSLSLVMKKI